MSVPSPLDNPRFPDEPPLSVWNIGGQSVVGPPDSFGTPVVHGAGKPWPLKEPSDGSPIGVQLVRGAPGVPDNQWTLVVDGVQCPYAPLPVDDSLPEADRPLDSVDTCRLPPPFSTRNNGLSSDLKVRPLALSVRLEEEAMAPVKVEVIVQQITFSAERISSAADRRGAATSEEAKCMGLDPNDLRNAEKCEVVEVARKELQTYRPRDAVAPAVSLPYPVAAPSQSAMAVASYREIDKWKERDANIKIHNSKAQEKYKEKQAKYEEDYKKHQEKVAEEREKGTKWEKLPRWKRKPINPPTIKTNDAEVKDTHRVFIIGGREESVARAWGNIMDELTRVCCLTASDPNDKELEGADDSELWYRNKGASLYTHLEVMRKVLGQDGSTTALAVLEAFLSGDTSPLVIDQLRPKYNVTDDGEVSFELDEAVQRQSGEDAYLDRLWERPNWQTEKAKRGMATREDLTRDKLNRYERAAMEANGEKALLEIKQTREAEYEKRVGNRKQLALENTSQLVYEFMPFDRRLNTHTRLRVLFEITEFAGGPPKTIALEPRRYDAYAAHAVYAELPADVKFAEEATDRFVDCLLGLYKKRGFLGKGKDGLKWLNRWQTLAYNWTLGWYRGEYPTPIRLPLKPTNMQPVISEAKAMMGSILPMWPPPAYASEVAAATPLEETAEDRQLQAQLTSSVQGLQDRTAPENVLARGDAQTARAREASDPKSDGPSTELPNIKLDEEAYANRQLVEAPRQLDESTAIVVAKPRVLVVRELPQIVQPTSVLVPSLKVPDDVGAPDEYFAPYGNAIGLLGSVAIAAGFVMQTILLDAKARQMLMPFVEGFTLANFLGGIFVGEGALAPVAAFVTGNGASLYATLAPLLTFWPAVAVSGLFAVGGYLAYASFWAKAQELKWEGRIFGASVGASYKTWACIAEWQRLKHKENADRSNIYDNAVRKARGVPVLTSLISTRVALKKLQAKRNKEFQEDRGLLTLNVLYNVITGVRFKYVEYYEVDALPALADLKALPKVYDDAAWDVVPDNTSLLLLPPSDVVETLYEAETLRKVPMRLAVQRTVGTAPPLTPSTPAELAARSAHLELTEFVRAGRFPYNGKLTGEDLLASAARVALQLAEEAVALITAAYGSAAGVTLVMGDDPVWTCLPAGVAARIGVRHAAVFERAELARRKATDAQAQLKEAISQWGRPQRAIMQEFGKAWVAEARAFLRDTEKRKAPPPDIRSLSIDAARAYARIGALTATDDLLPRLVVASAFSSWMIQVGDNNEVAAQIQAVITSNQATARRFQDQPKQRTLPKTVAAAARWAARRLDWEAVRAWSLNGRKNGVDALTETLSELNVDDGKERVYYCPLGSRLQALPGHVPFAVGALGNHLVWLDVLLPMFDYVRSGLRLRSKQGPDDSVILQGRILAPFSEETGGPKGLGRHPLAVSSISGRVVVSLARATSVGILLPNEEAPTVLDAFKKLLLDATACEAVQQLMMAMRARAFNVDRLLNGLDLAASQFTNGQAVTVSFPETSSADFCDVAATCNDTLHNER